MPPRLDRAALVDAALRMVDAEGLEALTLRRLAAAVGVQAASLYWHFKSKQDLMAELAQAMLAGIVPGLPPDDTPWPAWMEHMALALRAAMLARRDGARIVAGAYLDRAPALAELWERGMAVLVAADVELLHASHVVTTLITYTFGYVIEEQSQPAELPEPEPDERHPWMGLAMGLRDAAGPEVNFLAGVRLIVKGAQDSQAGGQPRTGKRT